MATIRVHEEYSHEQPEHAEWLRPGDGSPEDDEYGTAVEMTDEQAARFREASDRFQADLEHAELKIREMQQWISVLHKEYREATAWVLALRDAADRAEEDAEEAQFRAEQKRRALAEQIQQTSWDQEYGRVLWARTPGTDEQRKRAARSTNAVWRTPQPTVLHRIGCVKVTAAGLASPLAPHADPAIGNAYLYDYSPRGIRGHQAVDLYLRPETIVCGICRPEESLIAWRPEQADALLAERLRRESVQERLTEAPLKKALEGCGVPWRVPNRSGLTVVNALNYRNVQPGEVVIGYRLAGQPYADEIPAEYCDAVMTAALRRKEWDVHWYRSYGIEEKYLVVRLKTKAERRAEREGAAV